MFFGRILKGMTNFYKSQKGFTLIELLVVIAIIGILASVVLVSLGSARTSGGDAKIKSQLNSFRTAMELYYASNNNYGPAGTAADGCSATPTLAPYTDTATGLVNLADEDNYPTGNSLTCWDNRAAGTAATQWAAQGRLGGGTGNYYCVDYTGLSRENAASMMGSGDLSCL